MLLRTRSQAPRRRGVILLVVLAMLTLFTGVGITFVYFSESQATQAANTKEGETLKLPDPDMVFSYALRQLVYPTNDNRTVLYRHSLLENLYGSSGIAPHNGSGRIGRLWRDNQAGVIDPHIQANPLMAPPSPALIGQDELFRLNYQGRAYDEPTHGALNPPYTYPDHKNPFLGVVAGDWRDKNYVPALNNSHGPVALARSFARELKFRVAIVDTTGAPANVVGYQEVVVNPFSNTDYAYWIPGGNVFRKPITLPAMNAPFQYSWNSVIQFDAANNTPVVVLDAATCQAHTIRPNPRQNPFFAPPADFGGDVKNLPPEVKTLVGYDAAGNPMFADNDSYWMDLGFPAIRWSNNKKIKPMVAMFIMANDGKVNLNTAGNLRGRDTTNPAEPTYSASGQGLHQGEVNPLKIGIPLAEVELLLAGRAMTPGANPVVVPGRNGFNPAADPITTAAAGYIPILPNGPYYSRYDMDGTYDGVAGAANEYRKPQRYLLPGEIRFVAPVNPPDPPTTTFRRWPFYNRAQEGFGNGGVREWTRNGARSPLYTSPFVGPQYTVPPPPVTNTGTGQRTFGLDNAEALYRASDTGADALNSDIRRLIPTAFSTPHQRWMLGVHSGDLNSVGAAPWLANDVTQNLARYNFYPPRPPAVLPQLPPLTRDMTPGRISGQQVAPRWMPPGPNRPGEFVPNTWRSLSGNTDRLDLSRQLPDYPAPANANSQLDLTIPVVRAQYFVALRARQRFAMEIYEKLAFVTHPLETGSPSLYAAKRYLAQLAVNIVDYIDNDDYSTWLIVPDVQNPPLANQIAEQIVWGTELPRLVLNEIYAEAVTGSPDASGNTEFYHVRHWVELYNTLSNGTFGAWPDGANARLNIAGTPVYRLLLTTSNNLEDGNAPWVAGNPTTNAIRVNPGNTLGMPRDMTPARTKVVNFATLTNPPNWVIAPSETSGPPNATVPNYGTGLPDTTTAPANPENRGFYVVGHDAPPESVTNFITPDFATPEMELRDGLTAVGTAFDNNALANQSAVLLQRLANPYLPYNPVDPADAAHRPNDPYNPYITVDYADHIFINHAITSNRAGTPDRRDPQERYSMGKIQPYASFAMVDQTINQVISMWTRQYPDGDWTTPNSDRTREEYPDRPQHTFHRHNGVNAVPLPSGLIAQPSPGLTGGGTPPNDVKSGLAVNTLRSPFDWLVHLDRGLVSPAELLHVSGYRPHELTQQFNQFATVQGAFPPGPNPITFTGPTPFTISNVQVFGTFNGVSWALRNNDLVYVSYPNTQAGGSNPHSEWALVTRVTSANTVDLMLGQSGQTVNIPPNSPITIRAIVPFAHYAPWFQTAGITPGAPAPIDPTNQSTNRLYRFLEFVAVRNPGVDMGQLPFNSQFPGGVNNVGDVLPDGSRWVQLNSGVNPPSSALLPSPALMPMIRPNDALLGITEGDPIVPPLTPPNVNPPRLPNGAIAVGDTLVAIDATGVVQRVAVLEVDWQTNRIRTVLPATPNTAAINLGMTFYYTYHSGRQLGRININENWDEPVTLALADVQPMNYLAFNIPSDPDPMIKRLHQRLIQQRQPMFYSTLPTFPDPMNGGAATQFSSRLPGHTGRVILDPFNATPALRYIKIPEDRPFQGMAAGDVPLTPVPNFGTPGGPYNTTNAGILENPLQGIGNTWLSDRYQEGSPMPSEANDPYSALRTLFEVSPPFFDPATLPPAPPPPAPLGLGIDHPYRRYEMLGKVWNNATVRSNTFSVWMTIGYFEYDEVIGLGAELNLATGKNIRHRFFCVVDRTSIDSWLKSQQLYVTTPELANAQPDGIEDLRPDKIPSLDPRAQTFTDLTVYSPPGSYSTVAGNVAQITFPNTPYPNPFVTQTATALVHHYGRLVQVESAAGVETTMLLDPRDYSTLPPALVPPPGRRVLPTQYPGVVPPQQVPATYPDNHRIFVRLTLAHSGPLTVRPLPIPPTVLYWSQIK